MTPIKVNPANLFATIHETWSPKIVAELNDSLVKFVRLKGEFVWHHHEHEDEFFWVVRGELTIKLRDGRVCLREGEFTVIPRGVEHGPVADEECWVVLIEPRGTLNTGNVRNERTVEQLEDIRGATAAQP
jgi:mannose-6-phosphate isomerase-like protein (cupin superfamily)